jgi:hypothetical protein
MYIWKANKERFAEDFLTTYRESKLFNKNIFFFIEKKLQLSSQAWQLSKLLTANAKSEVTETENLRERPQSFTPTVAKNLGTTK